MKSVVITGASGGLGGALSRELSESGWRVFGTARDPGTVPRAEGPGEVVPIELELTSSESVESAAAAVMESTGDRGLDGLVNNAGLIVQGPLEVVPMDELRHEFEVNVLGQMAITQALLPELRSARGRLVNVGAPTGRTAAPLLGPIGASKAAFHSLTDVLRMELRHQGIDVSLVVPGALDTEIFAKAATAAEKAGPSSPEAERVYAGAVAAASEAMAEMKVSAVDETVKAIRAALTERRPKRRYTVGSDARQFELLAHLPAGIRERLIMRTLGIGPQAFERQDGSAGAEPAASTA
jgi:NAD(P)-dependent dehydrogenase (short-subunit alcohol dehydrogenase family)